MTLGVLLAAGTGSRFEESAVGDADHLPDNDEHRPDDNEHPPDNKLLADIDAVPVVAHAARTLTESSLDKVVAVVGHDRERVAAALPSEFETVHNPDYERGQSTSVRTGVAVAREREADSILFALGDMPCVAVETVETLLGAYREADAGGSDDAGGADDAGGSDDAGIVAPRYHGRRGNPVLFDARYFDALADVSGDRGGRDLLDTEPVTWVDVDNPGVHRDVDTVADLRDLRELR